MRTFNVTLFPQRQHVTVQAPTTVVAAEMALDMAGDADWAFIKRADPFWREVRDAKLGPPWPTGMRVIFR